MHMRLKRRLMRLIIFPQLRAVSRLFVFEPDCCCPSHPSDSLVYIMLAELTFCVLGDEAVLLCWLDSI
jgi:hypothetical protein